MHTHERRGRKVTQNKRAPKRKKHATLRLRFRRRVSIRFACNGQPSLSEIGLVDEVEKNAVSIFLARFLYGDKTIRG